MPNNKYPPEIWERAARLVLDHGHEYPPQWKAICSIADKSNVNRETLRQWVRRRERVPVVVQTPPTHERTRLTDPKRGSRS